jgi:hypothetical protein
MPATCGSWRASDDADARRHDRAGRGYSHRRFSRCFFAAYRAELEEWVANHSSFWGHFSVRAHAMEAGAFVLSACGIIDESDIPDTFPHKGRMNIRYARGGSLIIAPLGIPLAGPNEGPRSSKRNYRPGW